MNDLLHKVWRCWLTLPRALDDDMRTQMAADCELGVGRGRTIGREVAVTERNLKMPGWLPGAVTRKRKTS
ncbi:hypothetical protein DPEC_G00283330 [Dallia pectoralis]|uniref:Uncharacterized protein n=1 Tax=Dallia pectoralis TaxID=75939 RepID=A0ACC2FJ60_DALPE|nr:hypothetical protein DPEC_G00283330 [Dallia pectoralis]